MKTSVYGIVKTVMVTEKANDLMEQGKYCFKVNPKANKVEITKAIEEIFEVKVEAVNTQNYTGKRKRMRGVKMGRRSNWKKAIVTLAAGQSIEIY